VDMNFSEGELIMFIPDMPDVPQQYASGMLAQASQSGWITNTRDCWTGFPVKPLIRPQQAAVKYRL